MPMPSYVLLYGTLIAGEAGHQALGLSRRLTPLGVRTVPGLLFDLGAYPGLVPGDGVVTAELYRIDDPAVLADLDAFEGCDDGDPEATGFRRVRVPVALETGEVAQAWIYVYRGSLSDASMIPSGSWRCHVQGRR